MSATMQIELDANATNEIRELAAMMHRTPEETAEEMIAHAMHRARRYAFYLKKAGTVSPERGIEILRSMGKGMPPDPGDELPEEFVRRY
jgi:predicted transcriptional regulator